MARKLGLNLVKFFSVVGVVLCAFLCDGARAANSHLRSAGPISLGYVGLYYGLADPISGTWYVGGGFFGGEATAWLTVADTGRSACLLGASTQETYAAHTPPGIPLEPYPAVKFTDVGFGGLEDLAVTKPVRLMIAGQAEAGADPEEHSFYQAYGPIGGASPPSITMAASVQTLGEGEIDIDIVGMSILEGRVLHVDPQQVELLRCLYWATASSLTDSPPAAGGAGIYHVPITLQSFFSQPQNVEVGRHPMLPVSVRYSLSDAFATRTALFDTGSSVNFISASFAAEAGIDLGAPEDLTITVPGLGPGEENRPGYYVDALALALGAGREGDLLIIENSAVFIIPDDKMPRGLDAILGNAAFSPSAEFAETVVDDWYIDTRNPDHSYLVITVTELAGAVTVQGSIALGDFVGDVTVVPVTIEIRAVGNPPPLETHAVSLAPDGGYSFTTSLTGPHDLTAKGSHWLRQIRENINLTGTVTVNFNLINGDSDGDNEITTSDLANVLFAINTMPGDPNWLPEADLDGDEEVTTSDLATVLLNMDLYGAP